MKNILEISNITKTFADGTVALSDVSFNVEKGSFTVIAGPNGSGKSVLMSIIAGLEKQTEGKVINNAKDFNLSEHIGLVFQDADTQILGETPEEDILFGLKNLKIENRRLSKSEQEERVSSVLEKCGLTNKRFAPARFLSGGEKRRLCVASVLALDCSIIIFDEPFANLDWPSVKQVCAILKQLKESGTTVIALTHELEKILALADNFIVLQQGKICFNGTAIEGLKLNLSEWGIRNPVSNGQTLENLLWL